ncbi:envelope stress response membrane protein PspB [Psychromonas sp. MME2]|uniref:envelope stress response membrane protein PspB n=1 Tax=unclassified Psychromonas TaxID=2614957 RepID=UPI00339C5EDC
MSYLILPLSIFLVFVAPLWLFLHYRDKKNSNKALSSQDQEKLQMLLERCDEMQKRIISLQAILDKEAPQWRNNKNE